VEGLVTRAVVEAFSTNGRLKIASAADADAVLDGDVIGYSVFIIAFDKDANARQYRLIVTVNLQLRDRRKNEVLFKQTGVREQVDFRVQNAVSQTISLEETALKAAAVEIGRSIVSLTITRF
jgi:outer membrane lipopolysaccharide assembly protein LptE/RlpB